jgi:SNF2 family DNA or RNA helicase
VTKFTNLSSLVLPSIIQFRKLTAEKIDQYDLVIVSYNFLTNSKYHDYRLGKLQGVIQNDGLPGIDSYHWRRIILDEGHELNFKKSNLTSGLLEEIKRIPSDYRWLVSGTPFPDAKRGGILRNYLYWESSSLAEERSIQHLIPTLNQQLYRKNTKEGLSDQITIPDPQVVTEFLDMTQVERIIYQSALNDQARQIELCNHIKVSDHHLNILGNKPMTLSDIHSKMTTYYRGRVKWCDTRIKNVTEQLAEITTSTSTEEITPTASITTQVCTLQEKLTTLQSDHANHLARLKIFDTLSEKIEETESCPICLEDFKSQTKIVTKCGHLVCSNCIVGLYGANAHTATCHMCRCKLNKTDFEVVDSEVTTLPSNQVEQWGTKMAKLITDLQEVLANPNHRVIVFSQWNNMLKLVGKVLEEFQIGHLFLHGSVHVVNSRIRKFKLDASIRVVLLSSDRAASGLNLTEASHIVLLDTLNTDRDSAKVIEEQAIGRAVRLGQKNQVQVKRLIMRDTIEHDFYLRNVEHDATPV